MKRPPVEPRTEGEISDAVRLALGAEVDLVLWRNNTGVAEHATLDGDGKLRVDTVRYGLVRGGSDFVGVLAPRGRWFALEAKSATGRATPEQLAFLALVRRMGGFACIVRSVEDARAALARARTGASE